VRSTEQIAAHALVRMAEVFLMADSKTRGVKFTPQILFTTPLGEEDGLARTVYETLVPRAGLGEVVARVLEHDRDGEPVLLDGAKINADPGARLASPAQRIGLAFRDRHCSYPGCTRPPTWGLVRFNSLVGSSCLRRGVGRVRVARRGCGLGSRLAVG